MDSEFQEEKPEPSPTQVPGSQSEMGAARTATDNGDQNGGTSISDGVVHTCKRRFQLKICKGHTTRHENLNLKWVAVATIEMSLINTTTELETREQFLDY